MSLPTSEGAVKKAEANVASEIGLEDDEVQPDGLDDDDDDTLRAHFYACLGGGDGRDGDGGEGSGACSSAAVEDPH